MEVSTKPGAIHPANSERIGKTKVRLKKTYIIIHRPQQLLKLGELDRGNAHIINIDYFCLRKLLMWVL